MIKLSLVVPTVNRCAPLSCLLESLGRQTLPESDFEVIVVDNGSTDSTHQTVASYQKKIGNLLYHFEPTPGLHAARHAGLRVARSDILVYADDDIEAFPTWLEGVEEAFEDKSVAAVGGKCLPNFEGRPPEWLEQMWERRDPDGARILSYLSIIDLGEDIRKMNPECIFGCNMSIRKHVLLEAGGFHPDSMPDHLIRYRGDGETHVMRHISRKGHKALYHPKASVYHAVPTNRMSTEYLCQRAFRQGISDSYTEARQRLLAPDPLPRRVIKRARKIVGSTFRVGRKRKQNGREWAIDKSYYEGWTYHAAELAKDRDLVAWVSREDYLH